MASLPLHRTGIAPEWVDYNGHLRDAYYWLIVSLATDELMDRIGLDAAYRERTRCTLYTLEGHIHYLREVKQADTVLTAVRLLGVDGKRIHAAFTLCREGSAEPAAVAELMLLHVRQGPTVTSAAFPPEVTEALRRLATETSGDTLDLPGSRQMHLRGRR